MMEILPLVAPFAGERYADSSLLSQLISPPYDVISDQFRAELVSRHDRNIVRLILPDGGDDRYANAASIAQAWREDGTITAESEPGVYVLQQTFVTPGGKQFTRTEC